LCNAYFSQTERENKRERERERERWGWWGGESGHGINVKSGEMGSTIPPVQAFLTQKDAAGSISIDIGPIDSGRNLFSLIWTNQSNLTLCTKVDTGGYVG
jgi:hypothetical protein